jgi:hypothetical protein
VRLHHHQILVFIGFFMGLNGVPGLSEPRPLSIWIGGQEIHLGAPVVQVASALSGKNFMVQAEATDSKLPLRAWWVFGPSDGEWASTFAVIYSKGNSIVGVENRTAAAQTVQDAFNALFGSVSKVSDQDRNPCRIEPSSSYVTNGTIASVQVDCSGFRIGFTRVEFSDDKGPHTNYEVWESIGTVRTAR